MSPGAQKYRACDKKQRYRSEDDAMQAAAGYRKHRDRTRLAVRAYECEFCGGYHLTSKPERQES